MFTRHRERALGLLCLLAALCCSKDSSASDVDLSIPTPMAIVVVPVGWESAVDSWRHYRRMQGYTVEVIAAQATAEQTRSAIAMKVRSIENSNIFVILAADATPINQVHALEAGEPYVPTFYLPSEAIVRFGGEPEIATDYPYGDLNQDGDCECAVGRIPANNPKQLEQMLNRSIQYEQLSICGDWQYEMNLVAGVGGFSMLADMAINGFAKAVLMESLPKEFQLYLTQASPQSPYFPPAPKFRTVVVEQLNRNSLLWVYTGHGSIQELDRVQVGNQHYPILTSNDVAALHSSHSSSLAFLLACYSGAFDAPMPCLGEMMVKNGEGPVAVIGATRVSMPYGMGVLAKEMLHEAFAKHTATIGEVLRNAKQTSIHVNPNEVIEGDTSINAMMSTMATALSPSDHDLIKEIEEHRWLMNLMGDPTLRLPSSEPLAFECSLDMERKVASVKGNADFAGELVMEIQCIRGAVSNEARKLISAETKVAKERLEVSENDALHRYRAVNDTVLAQMNKAVGKGEFSAEIALPDDVLGDYQVRCTICNRKQSTVGLQNIAIKR